MVGLAEADNQNMITMKKFLILTILATFIAANASADDGYFRKKHRAFSYSSMEMSSGGQALKNNYGAAFTSTRTYYLHEDPIAGFMKFGIDATWIDLSYNNYSTTVLVEDEGPVDSQLHQAEIGLQAGISLTFNPVDKLNVAIYGRYAPTFSASYSTADATVLGGYMGYIVAGGRISYKFIGLGAEYRSGSGEMNDFLEGGTSPLQMKGFRAYISFSF